MIDVRARENSGARNGLRFLMRAAATVLTLLFIASCGSDIILVGTPVITLTAQRGHFLSYIVTIDEIEMTRKDGTIIELPTVSERVDLANLGNYVQLLEAPAIGIGTYVSATFFIDYTSAYITVDAGGTAAPTTLTDADTALTPTVDTVTVKFDPNNPLVIQNQVSSLVNFNVDLDASNTINTTAGASLVPVTTHPFFTVTSTPVYTQPVLARGLFVYVNSNLGQFTLNTRPLHDVLDNPFGAVTVQPSASTYYNINGVTYIGAAGLAALEKLESQTDLLQIAAVGTGPGIGNPWYDLSGVTPAFNATQVYAGSSLESTIQDHIVGWVTQIQSGNQSQIATLDSTSGSVTTLTVQNAALVDRLGDYGYQDTAPVVIANPTIVSIDGVAPASSPSLSNISVGQFIDVSGQVTVDESGNPTGLDATEGQVRLQPTSIWGTLVSGTTTSATLDLEWIQDLEPTYIKFAGTGQTTAQDATTASYVVDTGSVTTGSADQSATPAGTLLNIVGLANSYGAGPPYFNATSITPASALPERLILEYTEPAGSPQPFSLIAGTGLFVNLADTTLTGAHVVEVGPQTTADVLSLGLTSLQIIPSTAAPVSSNSFVVGNTDNGQAIFSDPNAFAADVEYFTGAVGGVQKIVADGQFDATAGIFVATNIEVVIQK